MAAADEPEVLDCGKYAGMTDLEARKAILATWRPAVPQDRAAAPTTWAPATAATPPSSRWSPSSGSSRWSRWPSPPSRLCDNGEIKFVPERFDQDLLSTGWRTSATGASAVSSGGATASRPGTATTAARSIVAKEAPDRLPQVRQHPSAPGRGHAGHLVLLRAVALLHPGLAGRDAEELQVLLPHQHAGHRLRHHLLLGRPHDLLRPGAHRQGARSTPC